MKSRGCAKPTIELVQSGQSLILKFNEMEFQIEAWSSLDQLNGRCDAPPTFSNRVESHRPFWGAKLHLLCRTSCGDFCT